MPTRARAPGCRTRKRSRRQVIPNGTPSRKDCITAEVRVKCHRPLFWSATPTSRLFHPSVRGGARQANRRFNIHGFTYFCWREWLWKRSPKKKKRTSSLAFQLVEVGRRLELQTIKAFSLKTTELHSTSPPLPSVSANTKWYLSGVSAAFTKLSSVGRLSSGPKLCADLDVIAGGGRCTRGGGGRGELFRYDSASVPNPRTSANPLGLNNSEK